KSCGREDLLARRFVLVRRKLFWVPAGMLATWALLGFVVVPRMLRTELPLRLHEALKRPITIADISFNPFTFALDLHDFTVAEKGGEPFVALKRLRVNVSLESLLHGKIVLDDVVLDAPRVTLTVGPDGA